MSRWAVVTLPNVVAENCRVRNIYPVLASGDNKPLRLLIIAVAVLHGAMALAMKVLFFSYSVAGVNLGPDPIEEPIPDSSFRL